LRAYAAAVARVLIDLVRGALIGIAEVIPGLSGGTIALIIGLYRTLIESIADAVGAGLRLIRGDVAGARQLLAHIRWRVLLPVGAGMAAAVVVGAALLEPLVEDYPVQARALFFGLVAMGLVVPIRMTGRWRLGDAVVAVLAAAAAAILVGLPPGTVADPGPLQIFGAAGVAVCALVLPGVSGSFLLVSLGMYEPTIAAVNDRDLGYLVVFAAGMAFGLAAFVTFLRWLLENRRHITLVVLTGVMAGSLRALWPWQTDDRDLLAPTGDIAPIIGLAVLGALIVVVLLAAESRLARLLHDPALVPAADPDERNL
jgi:putative membrane protein